MTYLRFYIAFIFLFSIFSYLFIDINLIYLNKIYSGYFHENRFLVSSVYFIFITFFYFIFFRIKKKLNLLSREALFKYTIILGFIAFLSYPAMLSFDIFNYITTAKITYFYKENPYTVMPIEIPNNTYLDFTRASNKIALYGPAWILITGLPHFLGFGNFIITLFAFKGVAFIAYLSAVYVIYLISKDIKSTAMFAFNPLVIVESLVSAHNDIVMICLIILSIYFFRSKRFFMSTLFFALSVLIKYSTLFLIPSFIYIQYLRYKKKNIELKNIYYLFSASMFLIFLLSPIREEMYPWYALWFIPFVILTRNDLLNKICIFFTYGLLLRYIPYMLTGDYFGLTPIFRNILMATPVFIYILYFFIKSKKVW